MGILRNLDKFRVWGFAGVKDFATKKIAWRMAARRFEKMARCERKRGAAPPEPGITLIGDFFSGASNSKTLRDFAFSLKECGIPFQTFPVDRSRVVPGSDVDGIITPPGEFRLFRFSHVVEMFRSPLPRRLAPSRARIAFWEGEHGMLETWPFLAGPDPVIAMSDFNAEYFRKEFSSPVFKILYPLRKIDFRLSAPVVTRRRIGIPENAFMVFFNFDFGSYRRKNPLAAVRAFAKAFANVRDAVLVFKVQGAKSHAHEMAEVRREAESCGVADRFRVVCDYLPQQELYSLTAACDVYLSLHKGEGFGLGMAEAMQMGKCVVATGWSANMEFTRPDVALPVKYRLVPVKPDEYFVSMKEWAEADEDDAARHLRHCYEDRAFSAAIGAKAKAFMEEHFSAAAFKKSVEEFLLAEHSSAISTKDSEDGQTVFGQNQTVFGQNSQNGQNSQADRGIHVAMAANHRYARGLNATLASMINAASDKDRLCFHVFDDGLEEADRAEARSLAARFGYNRPIDFRSSGLKQHLSRFAAYHGSQTAYLRLFFPELFGDLDWLLWTDVDVLWFRDPAELWSKRDSGVSLLWVQDVRSSRLAAAKMAVWRPGMDPSRYACSGVMLMNLKRMRETGFVEKAVAFHGKWGSPHFADQDILNEICYDDAKFVDSRWDCMYPVKDADKGVVVHFNCIGPYFNDAAFRRFFPLFEIWFRYYAEVVEGRKGAAVASWWKRALYNAMALCYPASRLLAPLTDRIQPWASDLVQRMFFFAWLRRKKLWK